MAAPDDGADDLEKLRALLLERDREHIAALESRIEELEARLLRTPDRAEAISEALPLAIRHRRDNSGDLTPALMPDVEAALHQSIRADPTVMANALYPVMGPTIRKLIVSMLSFDQLRTGSTYSVSHAYLIHRATSLPLAVFAPEAAELDADMVSGMMEALRSFVQDAFDADDHDGLQDLRVGEVMLWVEWGPEAVLAVVGRGVAPPALRVQMQETLEGFHADHVDDLIAFNGDSSPFDPAVATLESLAERLDPKPTVGSRLRAALPTIIVLAIVIAIIVWLVLR